MLEKVTAGGTLSVIVGKYGRPDPDADQPDTVGSPQDVAADAFGNLYISDGDAGVVKKINANGAISVVAGDGAIGWPTPGPALGTALGSPRGLAIDAFGRIYLADSLNDDIFVMS
jgi:hypothetical protein